MEDPPRGPLAVYCFYFADDIVMLSDSHVIKQHRWSQH